MAWLGREHQREQLKVAQAHRMASLNPDDFRQYQREIAYVTDVPRER